MAKRDAFVADFKKLLETISDYSLPQWQFAYRNVIYSMGLEILKKFPSDVVGPDPSEPGGPAPRAAMGTANPWSPAGSGGPGGHPNTICELACAALGVGPSGKPPK